MNEWYQKTSGETLCHFHTDENGLSQEQASRRLAAHGANVLTEKKEKSTLQVFLSQFADLLVCILIAAAAFSILSGNEESAAVIVAVIILNAILGTIQHKKAETSLSSLKSLSSPHAKVLRGGQKTEIPSAEVVPGDILLLEAGDFISADGRILESHSLQANESALTGESANAEKQSGVIWQKVPLGDRTNMVYAGSLVTCGRASAIVTGTGMETEIGKIASLMNGTKSQKTPLQISLDQFSSRLAAGILALCSLVFALSLYRGMSLLDSLLFAVALAVAAIPEALSSIVTIVQAIGTQRMAKEHAIMKELKAVESLGCVSVICSDKTGTLTRNQMTVQEVFIDGQFLTPEALDLKNQLHRYLLYASVLSNDSAIVDGKGIGDPTELALVEMARKANVREELLRELMPRLEEIPFDPDRKLMSTRYSLHGVPTVLTKGAPDVLLDRAAYIRTGAGISPITDKTRDAILAANRRFSENGLRVLAFAYKEEDADGVLTLEDEADFIFLGLISMMDPPRKESKDAVANAKKAGIRTVMITGDHKITAAAIAKQIGIFEEGDLALTGAELDALSDKELDEKIERISVYARVSPENKLRIVDAWQKKDHVVSMTGDGVNDAPALKKADIGVAMGITGTEVSKDAASMILADDNFSTILKAVENGRNVYRNIKNAIQFLLSGNMAAILGVLYASLAALPMPFAPVHLLFINLLTDSLPAIAIGMEPSDGTLLFEKPRNPKEGILTKQFLGALLVQGGLIALSAMASFHLGLNTGNAGTASTMAFASLTAARLFHSFGCRSSRPLFHTGFSGNWYSLGAFALGILLLNLVLFVPFLQPLFAVTPLTPGQLAAVFLLAAAPAAVIQVFRLIRD